MRSVPAATAIDRLASGRFCPAVEVDAAQLERVLVNLLENALRYSSPADPVEVRAEREARRVVISVADHGPGSRAGEREAIFEPFWRGTGPATGDRASGSRSRAGSRS